MPGRKGVMNGCTKTPDLSLFVSALPNLYTCVNKKKTKTAIAGIKMYCHILKYNTAAIDIGTKSIKLGLLAINIPKSKPIKIILLRRLSSLYFVTKNVMAAIKRNDIASDENVKW